MVNDPLVAGRPAPDYRFERAAAAGKNTNSLFVCLAFSGGGTRAAALAYGVLDKLRQTRITWKGEEKSLLDEVDCISSISGAPSPPPTTGSSERAPSRSSAPASWT